MLFLDAKALHEVAYRREGTLEEVPFPLLLHALGVHQRSVVLEIRRNQLEKKILLEDGVPVECRSNLLHETLGKFLVVRGKISQEDYQRVLAESVSTGVSFGEVLTRLELISAYDFFKLLQQNLAEMLLDAFTWTGGTFRLNPDVPDADSPLKVKVPQLVLTGLTRYAPQPLVDANLGQLVGTPLVLHPSPPVPLAALKVGTRHSRLLQLLKQPLRLDELGAEARLPADELTRVLFALALLGVISPADRVPATPRTPTAVNLPVTPAPAPPMAEAPAVPTITEKERNDVVRAFLVHRKQDAFDLLGVSVSDDTAAFRAGYLRFAERFAPWRFSGPEHSALAEKAEDLFVAGARALASLLDAETRNSLIFRRQNAAHQPRDPSRYFAIKTELLDSEAQYRQGAARLAEGKWDEAGPFLDFASDCEPQNGLYRADAAWCRFMAGKSQPPHALADLAETLRLDPDCGVAVYYSGEVYRAAGDRTNAEAFLRRACKVMAGDRRPVEALKALLTSPAR